MKIYIPIRGPEIEELYPEYDRFLDDFKHLSNIPLLQDLLDNHEDEYKEIENITFEIIYSSKFENKENSQIKILSQKHKFFKTDYIEEFMLIDIAGKDVRLENPDFVWITVEHILSRLALLINITYATKVDFLPGVIYSSKNKYLEKTKVILSSLDFAYEIQLKIKWPNVLSLTLNETLKWYVANKLHPDHNSKNKLHRAVNSFSYQFSNLHEKSTSILFWTMLGIEALLADSSSNIISQIKTKTSLILGEPKEYKKKL